jgi:hypothetical protein
MKEICSSFYRKIRRTNHGAQAYTRISSLHSVAWTDHCRHGMDCTKFVLKNVTEIVNSWVTVKLILNWIQWLAIQWHATLETFSCFPCVWFIFALHKEMFSRSGHVAANNRMMWEKLIDKDVKEATVTYFDVCVIRLEGLGETTKNSNEVSRLSDRDLKEARVLITSFCSKGIIAVKH